MYNRKYKQMEQRLLKIINEHDAQLKTEEQVSTAVKGHLDNRRREIDDMTRERDREKEQKAAALDQEREEIMNNKQAAKEDYERIMQKIAEDNEDRKRLEELDKKQENDEQAKIQKKIAMEDAARYVQRRWDWFQTEGKFLAKKGKKGRKGKGKKKKK